MNERTDGRGRRTARKHNACADTVGWEGNNNTHKNKKLNPNTNRVNWSKDRCRHTKSQPKPALISNKFSHLCAYLFTVHNCDTIHTASSNSDHLLFHLSDNHHCSDAVCWRGSSAVSRSVTSPVERFTTDFQ